MLFHLHVGPHVDSKTICSVTFESINYDNLKIFQNYNIVQSLSHP